MVRPSVRPKTSKSSDNHRDSGLAEWIIDDTCLVFVVIVVYQSASSFAGASLRCQCKERDNLEERDFFLNLLVWYGLASMVYLVRLNMSGYAITKHVKHVLVFKISIMVLLTLGY